MPLPQLPEDKRITQPRDVVFCIAATGRLILAAGPSGSGQSFNVAEVLVQPSEDLFHQFAALRCYVVWRFKHDVPLVGCR